MSRDPINWIAIRTAYVVKGWSAQKCADEFKVDRATISRRASKEDWTAERRRNVTNAQQAITEEHRSATIDALALHASIADQIATSVQKWMEVDVAACKPGRSRAEALKVYAEAADKAIRLGRDVRGIRPGESSADTNEAETSVRIIREVVAPEAASAHA